jgi:UDP-N-acetylglucosamine 4,6-dehydratase/5-epimerase
LIVFSRDELKQYEMAQEVKDERVFYFLGDIRDRDRLMRACCGADFIVHAAALKQVPALEYNPQEAIKTNIQGASNIIDAAIENNVKRVVALSSDKAVNPINMYGASKLAMEKLFIAGNSYSGKKETRFSIVRYGNVAGSRGSVIPLFRSKAKCNEPLPITDTSMTRFWITLGQGVDLVLRALEIMKGGEIFIPKIPSFKITDLAQEIAPGYPCEVVGIRPGEKLHEVLISESESHMTFDYKDHFEIHPMFHSWYVGDRNVGNPVGEGFKYSSDTNSEWLDSQKLKEELCRI